VSWYEAEAYAQSVGKSLPAMAQWYLAAPPEVADYTVQLSNISHSAPAAVGTFKGMGPYGTFDMAGNVREWVENSLGADRRLILGGAAQSLSYIYSEPEALSPFDRSSSNGFRCLRNLGPLNPDVIKPVKTLERDFTKVKPASEEVFKAYQQAYAYDHTPLNPKLDSVAEETPDYRRERVTFDAGYGRERVPAYIYLPKRVRPPYQTVLFFPSARVLFLSKESELGDTEFFDYIVKSGRAVVYPIYQNTYERTKHTDLPGPAQATELTIERYRDVARSLDYLETRSDIARDKFAYLGVSMGAAQGVIFATLEQQRLKTVVFLDGGYFLGDFPGVWDQANFAPRLKKPVLMVNGRYDFSFSLDRAQEPLFRMLGTPAADKKHVVLETPHDVTADRPNLTKAVLEWLDKYLGRVE